MKRASKMLGSRKHLLCKRADSSIPGTNGEVERNSTNLYSDLHTCALAYTQQTHSSIYAVSGWTQPIMGYQRLATPPQQWEVMYGCRPQA